MLTSIRASSNSALKRSLLHSKGPLSVPYATVRFQSEAAVASTTSSASSCPFTGSGNVNGTKNSSRSTTDPELKHVISYPLVGSFIPSLSRVPDTIATDPYAFWKEMRQIYGDFYTIGMPGVGSAKDSKGTLHMVTDPREMAKVVRAGGSYPSGMAQNMWVNNKWSDTRNMNTGALFQDGEEWKRIRTFMQTDLLHPDAAKGYVPGMVKAAQIASKAAPMCKDNLNKFFNHTALDLFATIMFGELTKSADPNSDTNPENLVFAESVVKGLSTAVQILQDPFEGILGKGLGLTTKKQQYVFDHFDRVKDIGFRKVSTFVERKERGELNEHEKNSYLYRAIDRQKNDDSITVSEAQELAFIGLFAAVDTTSAILGWNVFNVARHPHVQEKLYDELSRSVSEIGSDHGDGPSLNADVLDRRNSPYLHAVIRETQRLTPATTIFTIKRVDSDIEVNGVPMTKGDVVGLEGYSIGMDPEYVDNPEKFVPERWLPDAVASRKGTPQQIIDHAFLKEPFSQGARRCPGSRVASNETQVLLSQLVLDWKMTTDVKSLKDVKYSQKTLLELDVPDIQFEARM